MLIHQHHPCDDKVGLKKKFRFLKNMLDLTVDQPALDASGEELKKSMKYCMEVVCPPLKGKG